MKVSINTPVMKMTAELQGEQVMILMRMVLDFIDGKQVETAPSAERIPCAKPDVTFVDKRGTGEKTVLQGHRAEGYKGFLYVKCEACGKPKGFCVKTPIRYHRCECGHETNLMDMKRLYVDCKCGAHFEYLTNITDDTASMECVKCGAPVDLEYHAKQNEYKTIK